MRTSCTEFGAIYLQTEANRGKQLRAAANIATKNILWFLHADSSPPADAVKVIRQHLQQTFDSGYFRFRFRRTATLVQKLAGTCH